MLHIWKRCKSLVSLLNNKLKAKRTHAAQLMMKALWCRGRGWLCQPISVDMDRHMCMMWRYKRDMLDSSLRLCDTTYLPTCRHIIQLLCNAQNCWSQNLGSTSFNKRRHQGGDTPTWSHAAAPCSSSSSCSSLLPSAKQDLSLILVSAWDYWAIMKALLMPAIFALKTMDLAPFLTWIDCQCERPILDKAILWQSYSRPLFGVWWSNGLLMC